MKNIPRLFSNLIGQFYSSPKLFSLSTPPFLPFYHVVSDDKLDHVRNYPFRNRKEFEKELDFILKHFEPVSLDFILKNPDTKKKIFHLSFDDGLKECHEIIAPILLRKGIPASFFINTNFADNKALYYKYKASLLKGKLISETADISKFLFKHKVQISSLLQLDYSKEQLLDSIAEEIGVDFSDYLKKNKPYLSKTQILELQNQGFSIGAHSLNHPEFWLISEDEQYRQIKESVEWVQKHIQPKISAFAFPYTDWRASARILKRIKSENICDVTFGTAGVKYDEFDFHFQRYPMEKNGNFVGQLKSEFVYFQLRKWIGKATVKH